MASFPGGYPAAPRLDLVEDLHGYRVADPYRWLEDADSPQTRQWLPAGGELWAGHRARLPRGDEFTARVRELLRVGSVGLPAWRGPARFAMRRDPDQEHAVLYVSDQANGPGEAERALIDPVAIDPTGRTTLDAWQPDKEGRLLAYQLSHGGDEESLLRVMDVATGEIVDGPLDRCRHSGGAGLQGLLLPPAAAGRRGSRRRVDVPPAGLPACRGNAAGDGHPGVRGGAGEDQLLRRERQQGRALADHFHFGRHRAARGHLDRGPDRGRPRGPGARPAH